MQRSGRAPCVGDSTKISKVEREAIVNNPEFMPQIAVLDNGNFTIAGTPDHKRPPGSIIGRVLHGHEHENKEEEPIKNIVRVFVMRLWTNHIGYL